MKQDPDAIPPQQKQPASTSVIKSWLLAMQKAKKIQPGGQLVFINKRTGAPVGNPGTPPAAPIPTGG